MLVPVAVVPRRRAVDRALHGREVDDVGPGVEGGTGRRLEARERAARVAARDAQQVLLGLRRQLDRAIEPAVVGHGPVQQPADVVVGERREGEHEGSGEQRRYHRERRVLGRRGHEGDPAVLHGGEQGVLLRLGEAVHLVDEQDGALSLHPEGVARALDHLAHVLHACGHGRQLDEAASRGRARDSGDQ